MPKSDDACVPKIFFENCATFIIKSGESRRRRPKYVASKVKVSSISVTVQG